MKNIRTSDVRILQKGKLSAYYSTFMPFYVHKLKRYSNRKLNNSPIVDIWSSPSPSLRTSIMDDMLLLAYSIAVSKGASRAYRNVCPFHFLSYIHFLSICVLSVLSSFHSRMSSEYCGNSQASRKTGSRCWTLQQMRRACRSTASAVSYATSVIASSTTTSLH